ncbi:fumarylacetoacetase [Orrella sp. JC864]|uniref:fumarylacetoacetase n=1 Tax=Orrella sp. JC864 TaxID=3120298 RepID=UPI003008AAD5
MPQLNETHDPDIRSWLASANDPATDFPPQNLPLGVFRPASEPAQAWRVGVALGDQIIDLARLASLEPFDGLAAQALAACTGDTLNPLMALQDEHWSALRLALSRAVRSGSVLEQAVSRCLHPQAQAAMGLPARIGDYTDFYISVHHATAVGRQFRPDNPLLPNYKWVPIGYHGRASSIGVSGQAFRRPRGQMRPPAEGQAPQFGPCRRLDYELEMGVFVGTGNALGEPIALDRAERHLFGLCLLNDWSARDIQAWEYQPLGPFLAKNFASTISPWIVTREALEPFRAAWQRPAEDPQPLPYLDSAANRSQGAYDVRLQVLLSTEQSRQRGLVPARLSASNLRHAYWSMAQLLAHHTVNGCNLQPGDLLGTGTLSGPEPHEAGSLLELSQGGKTPVQLPWGETRSFLEDGDQVILTAHCEAPGRRRLGFGSAAGMVLPALA